MIDAKLIHEIFDVAKNVFYGGIYVKTKGIHPCGWAFISFEFMDSEDEEIQIDFISDGINDFHPYENLTLFQLIEKVGMDGWCYEISSTDKF